MDEAVERRLARWGARLADAARAEARERRRLERLVGAGKDTAAGEVRLDQAAERVLAIARRIEEIAAPPEDTLPAPRVVDRGALTRSDDDPPIDDEAPLDSGGAGVPTAPAGRPRRSTGAAVRGRLRTTSPTVAAAIDIGSNSVHLLVAVVRGHRLQPLLDTSEFLGLGVAVDERAALGSELRERLVETVRGYVEQARMLGADRIAIVGTDPLRRAADGAEAAAAIDAATGERTHVIGHEEEAYLTLLGVTAGRPVVRDLVLVDIGGGSSEVLVVGPTAAPVAVGLPIGSARLTALIVEHDPPTAAELAELLVRARAAVDAAPAASPHEVIVVGGTASNLLRIVPASALDRTISRRRLAEALAILATESAAEASARHGIREARARVMAAGAAIVGALLERYDVECVRVAEVGIREGALLAAVHAGAAWRDHLTWLAHGWSRSPAARPTPSESGEDPSQAAPEGHAGDAPPRPAG
jgi:hypothetical protein